MYFIIPYMYFRVNLKMKKPALCYCFTLIVFIKLNFTVVLPLITKIWMTDLLVRWEEGGCGVGRFNNWGGSMGGRDDFEMRGGKVDTSLRTHFVLD